MHAAAALDGSCGLSGDEAVGVAIVRRALDAPLRQIAANAGLEGGVVVAKVRELGGGQGLDATTGEYVELAARGIVDPVKVTRAALINAASIASMVLTTASAVVEAPEEEPEPADAGHGHGHGHSHGPGF